MMGGKRSKGYFLNLLTNAAIIFASYFLAVFFRYKIFKTETDTMIKPFSLPFLFIALVYAVILSFTFDYEESPRFLQGDGIFSGISRIIFQNIIGCVVFSAVLFVIGIMNFSRWAVFLLGIFSCLGLILKQILMYSANARKRCEGMDVWKVLLIGNGKQAEEYIQAITKNPQFGIELVGYLGDDNRLETNLDGWFKPEEYPFPVVKWLGSYAPEKVEEITKEQTVHEVVVTEDMDLRSLTDLGLEVSVLLPCGKSIHRASRIRDLGEAKTIKANEDIKPKSNAKLGMVISVALLLIILVIKKFNLNAITVAYTMDGIEKSRSILFAFFAFFMYWTVTDRMEGKRNSLIYGAALTAVTCIAMIMVFEWIDGGPFWSNVMIDIIPVAVVIALFFFAKEAVKKISESFIGA